MTLTVDNDLFTGSDNNYTHGIALSWSTGEVGTYEADSLPRRWVELSSFVPFVAGEGYRKHASWTFGQEAHTPDDITNPVPPSDDQPYAGVLYLDSGLHTRNGPWGHNWNLRLGLVGPSTYAGEVQREIHELLDDEVPRGWDHQLPDEPILNLDYSASYLLHQGAVDGTASWRLVSLGSASVGTYFTGVSLGTYGEIGWNLGDAMGAARLRQGISAATTVGSRPQDSWSVSLFLGLAGYWVAHYLPLDGNVFRDSPSVDSNPLVGSISYGVCLRHKRLVFSFSQTYFTETFEGERKGAEFGSFSLGLYF